MFCRPRSMDLPSSPVSQTSALSNSGHCSNSSCLIGLCAKLLCYSRMPQSHSALGFITLPCVSLAWMWIVLLERACYSEVSRFAGFYHVSVRSREAMSLIYNSLRLLLFSLFLSVQVVNAQDAVALVFPPKQQGNSASTRSFPADQKVPLQWTSTFPMFTLQLWQGPDNDGTKAFKNLFSKLNATRSNTLVADRRFSERHVVHKKL